MPQLRHRGFGLTGCRHTLIASSRFYKKDSVLLAVRPAASLLAHVGRLEPVSRFSTKPHQAARVRGLANGWLPMIAQDPTQINPTAGACRVG